MSYAIRHTLAEQLITICVLLLLGGGYLYVTPVGARLDLLPRSRLPAFHLFIVPPDVSYGKGYPY